MEVNASHLISVAEAIDLLDSTPVAPRRERVALSQADGRVLATSVAADRDSPPFDKSLMDGYAVRAADVTPRGGLRRAREVAAGGDPGAALAAGECVAIMTGAPLPPGADAVVPVEWTNAQGDAVVMDRGLKPGHAVARRAAEARAGDALLPAGTRLGPAQLAVCAQVGAALVDVFAAPRVGVLSTGDEVVAYDTTPVGSQIRNSNSVLLCALVLRYGGQPEHLGHVPDDPAAIAEALAMPGLDAVLVSGGMSMGAYDYTPGVMRDMGYDLAITKLKIKPGKPFVFARRGLGAWGAGLGEDKTDPAASPSQALSPKPQAPPFLFGLPGNPVSAFVCAVRLVSRVLLRLHGVSPEPAWEIGTLAEALPANGPREFYQPVAIESGVIRPLAWGGSADLFTLARANALLPRMADEAALPAATVMPVLRLP